MSIGYALKLIPFSTSDPFSSRRRILSTKCKVSMGNEKLIERMRERISNGKVEMSPSAYDTAWVAMVPSREYSGIHQPSFPECLDWIVKNQNSDGSWGLSPGHPDLVKDSLSCTLACLLALRKWDVGHQLVSRGLEFIEANGWAAAQNDQFSPVGFNVIFPAMLNYAKEMDLTLPLSSTLLDKLHHLRDSQLRKGKQEYIAEGFGNSCNWKEIISKHQRINGSLFNSPATTAAAVIHSPDHQCSQYLISLLGSCDGCVPAIYPMNIFARLRMVDTLERFGLEPYFELNSILDEIYRSWLEKDEEIFCDISCLAMAFRLLRMRGYDVSSDELAKFVDQEQFFNSVSMPNGGVSTVLELYRASQIKFYEEESTLEKVHAWTSAFLKNQLLNQSILDKRIQKQVEYDVKNYRGTLDKFGQRRSIELYDPRDFQIMKTAYRCTLLHNEDILTLSVQDFKISQVQYGQELQQMRRWYTECRLDCLKPRKNISEYCYSLIAADIGDPELSKVRISYAQLVVFAFLIDELFDVYGSREEACSIIELVRKWDMQPPGSYCSQEVEILFTALYNTVNAIAAEAYAEQGYCVKHVLVSMLLEGLTSFARENNHWNDNSSLTLDDYLSFATKSILINIFIFGPIHFYGIKLPEKMWKSEEFSSLCEHVSLVSRVFNDLHSYKREHGENQMNSISVQTANGNVSEEEAVAKAEQLLEYNTRKVLEMVCRTEGSTLPRECKQLFWKACQMAYCIYAKYGAGDEFSTTQEVANDLKALLWEPIHLPTLLR